MWPFYLALRILEFAYLNSEMCSLEKVEFSSFKLVPVIHLIEN